MRVIFLDVDGVLNHVYTSERCGAVLGIDPKNARQLAEIVNQTGAVIVLTSTWKYEWHIDGNANSADGVYLEAALATFGMEIYDKTAEQEWSKRGAGIGAWLGDHCGEVESYVILDDEEFDYYTEGLSQRLIRTDRCVGLVEQDAEEAVRLLEIAVDQKG